MNYDELWWTVFLHVFPLKDIRFCFLFFVSNMWAKLQSSGLPDAMLVQITRLSFRIWRKQDVNKLSKWKTNTSILTHQGWHQGWHRCVEKVSRSGSLHLSSLPTGQDQIGIHPRLWRRDYADICRLKFSHLIFTHNWQCLTCHCHDRHCDDCGSGGFHATLSTPLVWGAVSLHCWTNWQSAYAEKTERSDPNR